MYQSGWSLIMKQLGELVLLKIFYGQVTVLFIDLAQGDKTSVTWKGLLSSEQTYRAFSHDITAAILLSQNNETVATLVSQINPVGVEIFSYETFSFVPINLHRCWPCDAIYLST